MKSGFTITRDEIDGIPAFLRVAERRSFRAAAADLGVSPSALSQTVKALEARLGVALFQRTTRSVGLTEAGQRFLERARPAMEGFREAIDAARSLGERPSGLLRINAARGVIAALIEPLLPGFIAAYPEIEVEIYADDGFADIAGAALTRASGLASCWRRIWLRSASARHSASSSSARRLISNGADAPKSLKTSVTMPASASARARHKPSTAGSSRMETTHSRLRSRAL